jgi:anti-sigma B factor antagonist
MHRKGAEDFAMRTVGEDDRRGCCVEVAGHLDVASAARLKSELLGLLDGGVSQLVVDLSATRSLDSSGVAVLVSVHQRLTRDAGALAVVMADDHIAERFERAGVDRLLTVAPSRDAAFAELEGD